MSAVLLVFQYGQPRIFFAMARDGLLPQWAAKLHPTRRIPYATTLLTGLLVASASLIGDAAETYDLTNIGTLFAFALVVHRRARAARTRSRIARGRSACRSSGRWRLLGTAACLFIMVGLPRQAWERFGIWLVVGLVLYFAYGFRHSRLHRG